MKLLIWKAMACDYEDYQGWPNCINYVYKQNTLLFLTKLSFLSSHWDDNGIAFNNLHFEGTKNCSYCVNEWPKSFPFLV